MPFYAHSRDGPEESWELLLAHLSAVSARAGAFGERFGAQEWAALAGSLHDLGKYDPVFQRRIRGEPVTHEHSIAGASIAAKDFQPLGKLIAYAVAGHHAGLADGIRDARSEPTRRSLKERLTNADTQARAALVLAKRDGLETPASLPMPPHKGVHAELQGFQLAFFGRMLFSCLVDADFLATEEFYVKAGEITVERPVATPLPELKRALEAHLSVVLAEAKDTPVNRLRAEILAHVRAKAESPPGVFTLTVPTGGGKTLASLAFALDHAVRHGLDRVITVIPFTSIIEQTADVYRRALAPHGEAVLEHHSAFDEEQIQRREGRDKLRLAAENWDASLVVTTAVQFFESLFADRPSRCRKLHNLAKSVIVLDEAQTLPVALLRPCVVALGELARNYGSTVVLCTATQPALIETDDEQRSFRHGFRIGPERELAPDPPRLFEALKRVAIEHAGKLSDVDLAGRLVDADQVLCIVNTRAHARDLYRLIREAQGSRHLSTLMCAAHRREILAGIRAELKAGRPCRVVSTSLIEAGVDVDFPLVYRAESGLDSIAQAAGRCNREGLLALGRTMVFEPDAERTLKTLRLYADAARTLLRRGGDPHAPETIEAYFHEVYWLKGDGLDEHRIVARCNESARNFDLPFESIARDFRMIDSLYVPVIVPFGDAAALVEKLRVLAALPQPVPIRSIARKLQTYTVGIPQSARDRLIKDGAAEPIGEPRYERQFVWLANGDLYRPETGMDWSDPTFRDAAGLIG